jgi:hypothetical protein
VDRLRDHDSVVVTLPQGQYLVPASFAARILAVEGMTVALEVENKVETARLTGHVPNAFLTFRHGDSLVGFRGTLHAVQPLGDFRFVVSDQDFRFVVSDQAATRSRSTRINCMTRVAIRRVSGDEPGEEVQGVSVNIASGGLLIEAAGTDAVTGDLIEFRLTHPDDRDAIVAGEATVVRHGDGLVAVAVTPDSADARAALAALVVARSRAALHRDHPPEAGG